MPTDTKELIAEAVRTLLIDCHAKKLTVKDIVEQCHITRQAFYYHFEDIPEMFRWMIEKETDRMLQEALSKKNAEEGLRCFFVMAVNAIPYIKSGMNSNYRTELELLLSQHIQNFFSIAVESKNLYPSYTRSEVQIILRYHSQAILGLFRRWTDEDTDRLDEIVHVVYCLMMKGISPL